MVYNKTAGTVDEGVDYYPYGGIAPTSFLISGQIYKFIGKERDAESGLDYFGFRYHASSMSRFHDP